jgi:hypothetical protein
VALSRPRPYQLSLRPSAQSLEAEYRVWSSGGRLRPGPLPTWAASPRPRGGLAR